MAKSAKQGISNEEFTLPLGNVERARQRKNPADKGYEEKVVIELPKDRSRTLEKGEDTERAVKSTTGTKAKAKDSKLFNWEVHRNLKNRFNNLALDLLRGMADFKYHKKDFFRLCVAFYVERMSEEGTYNIAGEEFVRYIQRRGKRPASDRYPKGGDKEKLVIELDSNTYQDYINIIYSHALMDGDTMNENLSTKFFLYDFVDMVENDLTAIVERYKSI